MSAKAPERSSDEPRHVFNERERDRALACLAVYSGSARRASQELAKEGMNISRATLERWRREDPAAYTRIRLELLPAIEAERKRYQRALARKLAGTDRLKGVAA
jgi:hypothetical protein